MSVRIKKRTHSLRGSKSYGWGYKKKRRGSGNKGGKGGAGYHKHKWLRTIKLGLHHPKKGFLPAQELKTPVSAINLGQIDQIADRLLKEGAAQKQGDLILVDLEKMGIDKVLGSGQTNKKLVVKAKYFSKGAQRKLKESGGQSITP